MNNIKVIADSTCDLSKDLLERYDISIIPLCINMDEISYKDGIDITPEEIFAWSDKTGNTPKTAAPVLNDAIEFIKPYVEANKDIIFIGISEDMSSTCNVIRLAGEFYDYHKIYSINSKSLSTGIGFQVLKAATMAEEGYPAEEIVHYISEVMRDKVKASFVVDTLIYLARGGRCSTVTALIGNTLRLKPMIVVSEGKMSVGKKYRGSHKAVLLKYANDLKENLLNADTDRVFITHSGCDDETVEELCNFLRELNVFKEITVTHAGGVITSHCGPGTLGILYVTK
ncbi:DegV family protein [Anaerocolumna sp.]|uniref:DegV family protein n=1 Tax=Anaerocolumna sp. TaxID=2041569 RepID=UPI0028ADF76C|nr:DegV family protein [Anaerocolumna sp.]